MSSAERYARARMRAKSSCAEPSCPRIATRAGRCDEHAPAAWADAEERRRRYSAPAGRQSRRLAARVRARDRNRCTACGAPTPPGAGAVDHRRPRSRGGASLEANLALLCDTCHDRKTRRERRART